MRVIYIQYKFHEIPSIGYICIPRYIWLRKEKSFKFRQSKGNNSSITEDTLMKLSVHNHTMVIIYIQYKFHEIPSIGYLAMAEDGKTNGRTDGQYQTYIPLKARDN